MKKISIIIPAYNEEEVAQECYNRLEEVLNKLNNYENEIIFINDGSKDKTLEILTELANQNENVYQTGNLKIYDDTKIVEVEGKEVKLTPTEFNILKFLTKNKGIVFSIEQIYKNVWEEECYGAENIIAVHIRHIREKIEINPREPKYLKVIWGVGYKIEKID